ncbi:MAG: hypothetical protein CMH49_05005 [Myxococcales bacterium]|nr:hypothetical protein [Myxococcales bacterium]
MSKKRLSLQSILDEERSEQGGNRRTSASSKAKKEQELDLDQGRDKSDFIRLSITISPEDFERLQDESMRRRRQRETYTFSHLARIALGEWLDKLEGKAKTKKGR